MSNQIKQWFVMVKDPRNGSTVKAFVQAEHVHAAKSLFEGMYGRGNVIGDPLEIK